MKCAILRGRRDGESGDAAVELVLIAPVLLVVLLFVVGLGRMAHARQQVNAAAADAARAASLERNLALSDGAARRTARADLGQAGVSCAQLQVAADLSDYRPGGKVQVTVTCTALLHDVAIAGLPGSRTFRSTATVPIETWRSS